MHFVRGYHLIVCLYRRVSADQFPPLQALLPSLFRLLGISAVVHSVSFVCFSSYRFCIMVQKGKTKLESTAVTTGRYENCGQVKKNGREGSAKQAWRRQTKRGSKLGWVCDLRKQLCMCVNK